LHGSLSHEVFANQMLACPQGHWRGTISNGEIVLVFFKGLPVQA
jgi:hypothetical protein